MRRRRLLPSPRPPRPCGGGVPLEEEAAKLSLGKDPTEKGSGEIMDDILGGGGGGEARWPEDLSTASDQRHDAKRKGQLLSKSSAPPTLSRAEAALDSISDLHEALLLLHSILTVSQTCISHGGRGGAPHHTSTTPTSQIDLCNSRKDEKRKSRVGAVPFLGRVKVPNSPLGLDQEK